MKDRIISVFNTVTDGKSEQLDVNNFNTPLKELGVDSVMLLSFLVALEDEFQFEWADEIDVEVFNTAEGITNYMQENILNG